MSGMDSTYGALFIGVLVSAVLFGVTMLQAFMYFQQYPADRWWTKAAVCWLWFLDAFHLTLSAHFVYYYIVVNYDNPSALLAMTWSYKLRSVVDAFVVVSVHTLYTFLLGIDEHVEPFGKEDRRWSAQKITLQQSVARWIMRRIVPYFVSLVVVIGYALAIVMCLETFRLDTFVRLSHAPFATYVPLVCSTFTDIIITGSLCYFLARCQTESGAMNGVLRTLMFYIVNTGIISSMCSVMGISMMIAYPRTFIAPAIEFLVIKLYINSYLAMLNARGDIAGTVHRAPPGFTPNTSMMFRDVGPEEKHQVVLAGFPQSASSLHMEILRPPSPIFDFEFPQTNNGPFLLRAPRVSHPDVNLPEYDSIGSIPSMHLSTIAERLALTPPMPEAVSPKSRPVELVAQPPGALRTIPSLSSPSHQHPQDYPSPPERTLSPLKFGSPPSGRNPLQPFDHVDLGLGHEVPPIVYSPKDAFTRMVSSARSRGKARRALFDSERGVAMMWGLHDERAERAV
ncbi:hypothetical protein LXA43DRAFT_1094544 [Ganoderma leucocontextum]|nr:hypothetical protein LXA43DRAFT_1094544 [Ganoderma leucocontextum]